MPINTRLMTGRATPSTGVSKAPGHTSNKPIPKGQCSRRDCYRPRVGGIWFQGGSWYCRKHMMELMPVRAHFDRTSDAAASWRNKNGITQMTQRDYKGP